MSYEKIVVVKKKTALEELLVRHATTSQVKFFLESRGESFTEYREAHDAYHKGLEKTTKGLPRGSRSQTIDKEQLATFLFSDKDLVVVVGDPGLFANTAKYVGAQPVLVVNPDEKRYTDVFTSSTPETFPELLEKVLRDKVTYEQLTLAQATLEDGQRLLALNDFFIGRRTHASARYEIRYGGRQERHSSSGVIVSTGSGSTAWLTSVYGGAYALASQTNREISFPRDANYLQFVVREPFATKTTGTSVIAGKITQGTALQLISHMPEEGVIFSDGIEEDYLSFTAGKRVIITPAEQKVKLVKRE